MCSSLPDRRLQYIHTYIHHDVCQLEQNACACCTKEGKKDTSTATHGYILITSPLSIIYQSSLSGPIRARHVSDDIQMTKRERWVTVVPLGTTLLGLDLDDGRWALPHPCILGRRRGEREDKEVASGQTRARMTGLVQAVFFYHPSMMDYGKAHGGPPLKPPVHSLPSPVQSCVIVLPSLPGLASTWLRSWNSGCELAVSGITNRYSSLSPARRNLGAVETRLSFFFFFLRLCSSFRSPMWTSLLVQCTLPSSTNKTTCITVTLTMIQSIYKRAPS